MEEVRVVGRIEHARPVQILEDLGILVHRVYPLHFEQPE
jgi:hypothetical protein